jgi:imidazoleglycerol-phosphate dehydratase
MVRIVRETRETKIEVQLERGTGKAKVATGRPFLDHMLATLARYGALDLTVSARGDLPHHLIEDVAIALGLAVEKLAASGPIARYGERTVPMDDALIQAVIDVGGRPYYEGRLPSAIYEHWMRSFADHARATLHVRVLRGRDRHHVIEAAFKALGLALRQALAEGDDTFSTKGGVETSSD